MFYLRKISGQGVEMNFTLGDDYTLIHNFRNPEEFKEALEIYEATKSPKNENKIFAFITGNGRTLPLFQIQQNYVMTGNGDTYAKIAP